jgi:nitrite reductase/ring-hydroxylating ferredoxin subunit
MPDTLEVTAMLVRVGSSADVAAEQMRGFDVAGTTVNVASVDGHLYAFEDTCTHRGDAPVKARASYRATARAGTNDRIIPI